MQQQTAGSPVQAGGARAALRALEERRDELNSQLTSLTIRRDLLTQQLRNADAAGQKQLQAMIADVGKQTERVVNELAATDATASKLTAEAARVTSTLPPGIGTLVVPPVPPTDLLAERVAILGAGALMMILLVAFARWLWRPKAVATQLGQVDVSRIEKLQQSIDVIAVEVERISESQRHLSKVLADRALGAGDVKDLAVNRDREGQQAKR